MSKPLFIYYKNQIKHKMILEKKVRFVLQFTLYSAILIYYIIAELPRIFITEQIMDENIVSLLRIIGLLVSFILIMSSFKWKWFLKILYRDKYIAGKYRGYSQKGATEESTKKEREEIIIEQTLLQTKLSGKSFRKEGEFKAKYNGSLLSEDLNNYKFLSL